MPIGLGLACLMFMSSCSKEDAQTLEPLTSERVDANMRGIPPILTAGPYLAPTYGLTGTNVYPGGWGRDLLCSNDLAAYPSGTSSLTHLFGKADFPWDEPLPAIPNAPNANSILTVSSATDFTADFDGTANKRSTVTTTIKNLKPGKYYSVNFYTSSTILKIAPQNQGIAYAYRIIVEKFRPDGTKMATSVKELNGKKATWITNSIGFTAQDSELTLKFSAVTNLNNKYVYGNIFVDQNSIKEINN